MYLCWHHFFILKYQSIQQSRRLPWSQPFKYNVYLVHILASSIENQKHELSTVYNRVTWLRLEWIRWRWYDPNVYSGTLLLGTSAWTRCNEGTCRCSVYVQTYLRRNSCETSGRMVLGLIYYEMLVLKICTDNHWPDTHKSLCWKKMNTVHKTVFTFASMNPYIMSYRKLSVTNIDINYIPYVSQN